jgi:hypothetical protein
VLVVLVVHPLHKHILQQLLLQFPQAQHPLIMFLLLVVVRVVINLQVVVVLVVFFKVQDIQ